MKCGGGGDGHGTAKLSEKKKNRLGWIVFNRKKSIHFFFKIDLGLIVLSHEKDEQIPKVGTWQKKFSKNKKT